MHLCQRFFQSSKHFSNSIFGIAFSSFSDALLMSSMAVKRRPFKVLFIFENRKKSRGTMSGEYGGWGIVTVLFLAKNSRTSNEVWAGALSWCKSHELSLTSLSRNWLFRLAPKLQYVDACLSLARYWAMLSPSFWFNWLNLYLSAISEGAGCKWFFTSSTIYWYLFGDGSVGVHKFRIRLYVSAPTTVSNVLAFLFSSMLLHITNSSNLSQCAVRVSSLASNASMFLIRAAMILPVRSAIRGNHEILTFSFRSFHRYLLIFILVANCYVQR